MKVLVNEGTKKPVGYLTRSSGWLAGWLVFLVLTPSRLFNAESCLHTHSHTHTHAQTQVS